MWVVALLSEVLLSQKDLILGENKRNRYLWNLLNFPITGPRDQGCMTSLMGTYRLQTPSVCSLWKSSSSCCCCFFFLFAVTNS